MSGDAGLRDVIGPSLGAAVARRSPGIAAALDEEQAWRRARAWAGSAVPDATVDAVRVRSVRYRPDGSCTLRYLVRVGPNGRQQVLMAEVPRDGRVVVVHPFPADPGLPTLPLAVDAARMREVLGRIVPGTGGERAIGRCAVDVVHHPREGRCVLRYRLSPGPAGAGELRHPVVFGKVYADPAAAPAAAAALRILRNGFRALRGGARIAVPEPLAVAPSLRLGVVAPIAGDALLPGLVKEACDRDPRAASASPALADALRAAARTAAAVHDCPTSGPRLPVRDLDGERAVTGRELELLEPVWPGVTARLRAAVADALQVPASGGSPGGRLRPAVLALGDLTPGQILLDADGGAGLVDVDTLCLGEPALDIGRFIAYLHVLGIRRSRSAWPLLATVTDLFLDAYFAAHHAATDATARRALVTRAAAYRALSLARLGASACWQLKDDRLGAVLAALDAGHDWMRERAG